MRAGVFRAGLGGGLGWSGRGRALLLVIGGEASTGVYGFNNGMDSLPMGRVLIVATVIILGLVGIGALLLGAFPPKPHRAPVEHVIPNDRFKS